jgi:hypothetical protein
MTVRIEESRGRGAAREVDDPCVFSRELPDVRIGADGENPAVLDGDRLGYGILRVHRDHVPVHEHRIRDEELRDGAAASGEDQGQDGEGRVFPHGG